MDAEAQVKEMDAGVEPDGPPGVDLNQATAEELGALPGIGPVLAGRIVAYREEQGGFQSPQELAAVPGIGRAAYEGLADRLTVTPPEMIPLPGSEEAVPEEPLEEALVPPEAAASREVAPPEAEEPVSALQLEGKMIPPSEEEEAPPAEETPEPPGVETVAPPSPPAPTREPPRRSSLSFPFSWLWSALFGGLLGMIFALLVFSGINGSLDLSNSRAVLDLQNRMDNSAAEMKSLRGEVDGLRQRLDALEGLTARMEKAESAVDTLRQETEALDQRADTLESEFAGVSENLSVMQAQAQQVTTFFDRLQALLKEVFGDEPAAGPTPESPVATPTPTQ
jgi:competence ComEA-like helix-hairpin-helix protein